MVRNVAVLGAGTMGAQIAAHAANAGLLVLLLDVTLEQARAGLKGLEKSSPAALFVPEKIRQIDIGTIDKDLGRLRQADWTIEAIVENLDIKKQLLEKVDKARRPGSLITTNTSGLSITALAAGRTEDFRRHWFGTHFFNPPRLMKLLDVFFHVADNIYQNAKHDPQREIFRVPQFMRFMAERNMLGAKTGLGFYKKEGDDILALDIDLLQYRPRRNPSFPSLEMAAGIESLPARLQALFKTGGREAAFVSELLASISDYAALCFSEIADDPDAVDRAMRWGFGWEMGPFELARALKGEAIQPASFLKRQRVIRQNAGASLLDIGDGVACLEFHSKMNTIGGDIISALFESLEEVNAHFAGLVIANEGRNFSAGANLMLLLMEAVEGNWDEIDYMVRTFQRATQAIRYNPKPIVTAPFALTLGGGCEIAMAAARAQAAAETYMGLVETGAGLIPAGGGTTEMLRRAAGRGTQRIREVFENIGLAKVSTSAEDARRFSYLRSEDGITMNSDRLIHDAKAVVLELAATGYRPPVPTEIPVFGESLGAELKLGIYLMQRAGHITEHEANIARRLAYVMCGGSVTRPSTAPEQYFLDLEREAFKSLCVERKTLARMEHLLKKGKVLRN